MGLHVAALGKSPAATVTRVGAFASMTALVCLHSISIRILEVTLGKGLTLRFPSWEKRWPHDVSLHS